MARSLSELRYGLFVAVRSGAPYSRMVILAWITGRSSWIRRPPFNLSQFQNPDELTAAFHVVRDSFVRRRVPLVFFDEFDASQGADKLVWLKHFVGCWEWPGGKLYPGEDFAAGLHWGQRSP